MRHRHSIKLGAAISDGRPIASTILAISVWAVVAALQAQMPAKAVDPKTKEEILAREKKLADAIEAHDAAALGPMLADYYADAFGDDEEAISKAEAVKNCRAGTLPSYRFVRPPQLSRNAEMIIVEGMARVSPDPATDLGPSDELVRVRRLWTQKNGQWLLVAQMRQNVDEEDDDKDEAEP
jgi:Domain of unknown function (DUF4440)